MTCCHRCATAQQFDSTVASRDLRRFRKRGPDASTRQLLVGVQAASLPAAASVLDIGGGIGAIHHVLLSRGFSRATHLDASEAYLAAAADEARRLGHADRVSFLLGAFPTEAVAVPPADVVTLDRVVCCDPDYANLLGAAAQHARHLVAFSYPRPRLVTRLVVATTNGLRRLAGRGFRAFVHPPQAMWAVLERAGLERSWSGGTWIWAVETWRR